MTVKNKVLLIFIVVTTNWFAKSEKDNSTNKNITGAPVSVGSRFFDLGQLFGPLFSNPNQNRPAENFGTNLPQNQNSQFQPDVPNPGNAWGYPNQGSLNPPQNQGFNPQGPNDPHQWQNPQFSNPGGPQNANNPTDFTNYPQRPPNQPVLNGPNQWQNLQGGNQNPTYPNYPNNQFPENNQNNNWKPENTDLGPNQFPNQGGSNGQPSQIQPPEQGQEWGQSRPNPTYPNNYQFPGNNQNANWRPEYPDQGSNQFPSQGGSNGPSQVQPPNQGQQWTQPRPNPDENRPAQFPGNNQNTNWRPEYPDQGSNQFPSQGGSNGPSQVQPPNQGQDWNQPRPIPNPNENRPQFPDQEYQRPDNGFNNHPSNNNQYPGQDPNQGGQNSNGGGTLDDIIPPSNNSSGNAILGKPVVVPTTTVNPDMIFFNDTSESPLQRQCVQDCPATPEYNPICGTNNVTYFNPGKFVCARNCGVPVYVARRGVCRRRPM